MWNTSLPSHSFLTTEQAGIPGQKGLILGERNHQDVKIRYTILRPYFCFLRASIFPAVCKEESEDRV